MAAVLARCAGAVSVFVRFTLPRRSTNRITPLVKAHKLLRVSTASALGRKEKAMRKAVGRLVLVLAIISFARTTAVLANTPAPVSLPSNLNSAVSAQGLPRLEIPPGGYVDVGPDDRTGVQGGRQFTRYRSDGSVFAVAREPTPGYADEIHYYFRDGREAMLHAMSVPSRPTLRTNPLRLTQSSRAAARRQTNCSAAGYALFGDLTGPKWYTQFVWYFNAGSAPGYLSRDTTETMLRR